ncbi:hypothetical protein AB0331_18980, partial [Dietzia maris]|uniref:hypothetical protein n=1 Tax=Dietzia maris TaxID=37915 RepID=UPI00344D14F1
MTNLDAEFAELIDTVGHRRAGILATTARKIATEIRTAADALGTAAVGPSQRHILAALPACTYRSVSNQMRREVLGWAWLVSGDRASGSLMVAF